MILILQSLVDLHGVFWEWLSIVSRLLVAVIVVVKLTRFYDLYKCSERIGLAIAGGCALMTAPVVVEGPQSPFSPWAAALFSVGVCIYFCGRLARQFRHARANAEQLRRAKARKANS